MNEAYWIRLATSAVKIVGTAIIVVGAFGTLAAFLIGMIKGTGEPRIDVAWLQHAR